MLLRNRAVNNRWTWIWRTTVRWIFAYDGRYAWSQSDAYQVFLICIRKFCIWQTNFPGPIESVISKFTCITLDDFAMNGWTAAWFPASSWCGLEPVPLLGFLLVAGEVFEWWQRWSPSWPRMDPFSVWHLKTLNLRSGKHYQSPSMTKITPAHFKVMFG